MDSKGFLTAIRTLKKKLRRRCIIPSCVIGSLLLLAVFVAYRGALYIVAHPHNHLGTAQPFLKDKQYESGQHYDADQHYGKVPRMSRTKPPFYPLNGTGQTIDISKDFDASRFQQFCKMDTGPVEVVVPVYSAPDNFERRKAMRDTFGRVCLRARCKMFFIIGVSLDKDVYDKVKGEYAAVNDILIVDKVDTYRDLNNKVVAMLDWLIAYCSEPKYVIRIIDDFFPNLIAIMDQLRSIKITRFVLGFPLYRASPFRHPASKWYVSKDEYPYSLFPTYVSGVVYAFLNTDSVALRQNVHKVEYCWIDDVWFGHVVQGSRFKYITLRQKYKDNAYSSINELKYIWHIHTGIHHVNSDQFYEIYNTVESR